MEHSFLGRLPPELRESIYQQVLPQEDTIVLLASDPKHGGRRLLDRDGNPNLSLQWTSATRNALALTKTCRLIREECLPLLYGAKTFVYLIMVEHRDMDCSREDRYVSPGSPAPVNWLRPLREWLAERKSDVDLMRSFELRFNNNMRFFPYDREAGFVECLKMAVMLFPPGQVLCALELPYVKDTSARPQSLSHLRVSPLTAQGALDVRFQRFVGPTRELHGQMKAQKISMQDYGRKIVELQGERRCLEPFLKYLSRELEASTGQACS